MVQINTKFSCHMLQDIFIQAKRKAKPSFYWCMSSFTQALIKCVIVVELEGINFFSAVHVKKVKCYIVKPVTILLARFSFHILVDMCSIKQCSLVVWPFLYPDLKFCIYWRVGSQLHQRTPGLQDCPRNVKQSATELC